jgi:hypothetical protein
MPYDIIVHHIIPKLELCDKAACSKKYIQLRDSKKKLVVRLDHGM